MYVKFFKRFFDVLLSAVGIVILLPVFIIIAVIIKIDSKGPVFFKQKRVGKNKTYFNIIKFRTMRIDTPSDIPTHMFENPDYYITKIGKFLRKSSLDEIPQIINIILGHMSIVGPRPALWNQYDLIAERDTYGANNIRPGLTGWAQINGRDELDTETKAMLDGEYIRRLGLFFDFRCFWGTITNVIRGKGIVEGNLENEKNTYYRS